MEGSFGDGAGGKSQGVNGIFGEDRKYGHIELPTEAL